MTGLPAEEECICGGTGLVTRLTETGDTGPEVCLDCFVPKSGGSGEAPAGLTRVREELEAALRNVEFYADEKNYKIIGNHAPVGVGKGSYARLAVQEIRNALAALRAGEVP